MCVEGEKIASTYHLLYLQLRKPLKMSLSELMWWRLSRIMTTGRSAPLLSALHCSARLARYCRRSFSRINENQKDKKKITQLNHRCNFRGKDFQKDKEAATEFHHCGQFSWMSTCRRTCFLDRTTLKPHAKMNKGTKLKASDWSIHIPIWWTQSLETCWQNILSPLENRLQWNILYISMNATFICI